MDISTNGQPNVWDCS